MQKKSSFSVIIPCFNEEESIPLFEIEMSEFYNAFKNEYSDTDLEFVFVDNNSDDNSYNLLMALASKFDFVRVLKCSIQGYGAALKAGFEYCSSDYLAMLDLDNTYPLKSLILMYKKIRSENFDIIYGARIHNESQILFIRKVGNMLYVQMLRFLLQSKLSDVCSGMRVFKSKLKPDILQLKTNDLSFSIDFTSMLMFKKYSVAEVPIGYRVRTGVSKLSIFKDGLLFLYVVLKKFALRRG